MMQPLGRKVLIQPLEAEDVSESGLVLVRDEREPDTVGRIIHIGPTAGRRWSAGVSALREVVSAFIAQAGDTELADHAQQVWSETADLVPEVELKVGQTVIIPTDRGHEITLDGVRYLLMYDEDILASLEDAEEIHG